MALVLVGRDTPIEITNNIMVVTSTYMISIAGIQNLELDHLDKVLEAQKMLETKVDQLTRRMDKLTQSCATSRNCFSHCSMERSKDPL